MDNETQNVILPNISNIAVEGAFDDDPIFATYAKEVLAQFDAYIAAHISKSNGKNTNEAGVTCLAKLGRSYRPICDAR
ncbi:MAG: hypothetical protein GY821_13230 [Gammaproteobacteria bacterium]|nr:hypothetical protein [Gammaproteobacteria bacterium]